MIRFVRAEGYRRLVAFHHPRNAAAIAMNRRLGFIQPLPPVTVSEAR